MPALPERLEKGEVRSWRYVNGYVDFSWNKKQGELQIALYAIRKHVMYMQLPDFIKDCSFTCKNCSVEKIGDLYKISMEPDASLLINENEKTKAVSQNP